MRGDERHVDKPVIQLTVQELLTIIKEARQLLGEEKKNIPQLYSLLQHNIGKLNSDQKKLITNRIDAALNVRVKQVLGEEYHFHNLRAIYGNMSHQLFAAGISLNAWLARVLGHKPGSISTAVSYTTVIISKQLPQEHADIKDRVTELDEEASALKAELAKSRAQVIEETTEVVEKKIENLSRADGVKLHNSEGEEVIFRRQPRMHDGKQLERLLRAIVELEKNKVRINWPNLRMLGYGDQVIKEYFNSGEHPDQRRKKKRKIEQVVVLPDNGIKT